MKIAGLKGNRATQKLLDRAQEGADLSRNYDLYRFRARRDISRGNDSSSTVWND